MCIPGASAHVESDAVPHFLGLGTEDRQAGEDVMRSIHNQGFDFDLEKHLEIECNAAKRTRVSNVCDCPFNPWWRVQMKTRD